MKNYIIRQYKKEDKAIWNTFISNAKNATFLFNRDFMDYHSDRFEDYSLLVFDESEKLVAVLPANRVGDTIYSHQGLTYGGIVFGNDLGGEKVEQIFNSILIFFKHYKLKSFAIKLLPTIYHEKHSNELDYFLFKNNAKLYRRDMNLAIDFSKNLSISKSKLKHFRRISELDVRIEQIDLLDEFWNKILIPRLELKHGVKPVHTLEEIVLLKSKFPENIRQYNAYYEDEIVAGITLFCSDNVVKSQYGATSEKGEKIRALDFLFINLINEYKHKISFFDMGIVNENNGKDYNKGLLKQKEELGCSIFSQDYYQLDI